MRTVQHLGLAAILALVGLPATAQDAPPKPDDKARLEQAIRALDIFVTEQPVTFPNHAQRLIQIPDVPPGDPHHDVMVMLRDQMNQSCAKCHAGGLKPERDDYWGLNLTPADETIREQLKLGSRGLVVASVAPGSPAATAGLKESDILLSCDGKDLATLEDLKAKIAEAKASTAIGPDEQVAQARRLAIKLLRDGEPMDLEVVPRTTAFVTYFQGQPAQLAATPKATSYWIGVSINPASATLRSQLKLGPYVGLVVNDVIKETPAEKAGLKKNDILLRIGNRLLKTQDDLVETVQAAKDKTQLTITYRRAGLEKVVALTPAAREQAPQATTATLAPADPKSYHVLELLQPGAWVKEVAPYLSNPQDPNSQAQREWVNAIRAWEVQNRNWQAKAPASPELNARLKELDARLKDLTGAIRELKEALPEKGKAPNR